MDTIEIPDIKKHYRIMINKDGLFLKEIKQSDADKKTCKILKKSVLKNDKQQITLHDGRNILVEKKNPYKVGDSILIQLPNQKILEHYKLQKGANAIILKGKNMGFEGEIKEIHNRKTMTEKSAVLIKSAATEIETLKDYIIVVGSSEKGK
jgi:small subunit ribosomal protein S4e